MTQDTITYNVSITLTSEGECPTLHELQDLLYSQLEGEMDESGLRVAAIVANFSEGDE